MRAGPARRISSFPEALAAGAAVSSPAVPPWAEAAVSAVPAASELAPSPARPRGAQASAARQLLERAAAVRPPHAAGSWPLRVASQAPWRQRPAALPASSAGRERSASVQRLPDSVCRQEPPEEPGSWRSGFDPSPQAGFRQAAAVAPSSREAHGRWRWHWHWRTAGRAAWRQPDYARHWARLAALVPALPEPLPDCPAACRRPAAADRWRPEAHERRYFQIAAEPKEQPPERLQALPWRLRPDSAFAEPPPSSAPMAAGQHAVPQRQHRQGQPRRRASGQSSIQVLRVQPHSR